MSGVAAASPIEAQIAQWREYLRHRAAIHGSDVAELEDHLRSQVDALRTQGLADDEAFLVAVKRMGSLDALSREFAREHSERLWKQLVLPGESGGHPVRHSSDALLALLLALAAALAVKLPEFFGRALASHPEFYARNASLLVLPLLAGYFLVKRRAGIVTVVWVALGFVAAGLAINVFPFPTRSDTLWLAALHLPIASWFLIGIAYVGGGWFGSERRMDFVRFSGEGFIYYVLIALGGGVLTACTLMLFSVIGLNAGRFVTTWLIPCGAAAAVLVAAWLVEAKQGVIENMAPVLTRLFTPLITLVLLAFLGAMAWTGHPIDIQRDVLIAFDLLLVLVVALVVYTVSARDPQAPAGVFDTLQLLLIVSAVAVDLLALAAISGRIFESGFTPNRVAALGENLILLVNLLGAAWLQWRFLRGHAAVAALERWQIAFLPVYGVWAAMVVALFPPLFDFR